MCAHFAILLYFVSHILYIHTSLIIKEGRNFLPENEDYVILFTSFSIDVSSCIHSCVKTTGSKANLRRYSETSGKCECIYATQELWINFRGPMVHTFMEKTLFLLDAGPTFLEDECTFGSQSCGKDSGMCQKTPYSTYECSCFDGYTKTSSGNGQARCIDTNECEIEDDLCPGTYENCQNQEGSFFCMCMNGFARISMESVCEDVNECLDKSIHNCTENPKMFCFNYPGSFECVDESSAQIKILSGLAGESWYGHRGSKIENTFDGIYEARDMNKCYVSQSNTEPWAVLDIPESLVIQIRILNRLDCCTDRIPSTTIHICSTGGENCFLCGTAASSDDLGWFTIDCDPGRIRGNEIRLDRTGTYLNFCEIEVFGQKWEAQDF